MAFFEVSREVNASVETVWERITDWASHGEFVPLTKIHNTDDGFNARTGIGAFGFNDPMRIEEWEPPHRCRLVKTGRVVRGWAEIVIEPTNAGSFLTWREELTVWGVPRFVDPLQRRVAAKLFSRVVDGLLDGI